MKKAVRVGKRGRMQSGSRTRRFGQRALVLVAGALVVAGVVVGQAVGQGLWFESAESLDEAWEPAAEALPDEPMEPHVFPAEDLGREPIAEDTRPVPEEVVVRVLALEEIAAQRRAERVQLEVLDLARRDADGRRSDRAAVRERPEAPPAMDSGHPDPDRVYPTDVTIGPR